MIRSFVVILLASAFLVGFTSAQMAATSKLSISGRWYYQGGGYFKSTDRKDISRWYEFKSGNKISFSTCTDMCGCMRVTSYGTYKWENDSIMSVTYTKEKDEYGGGVRKLKQPTKVHLKIKKLREKGLSISRVE